MDTTKINNRANFKASDSLEEKIRKHHKNVNNVLKRAGQGEIINLSDLMIDHETLREEQGKE